MSILNITRNSAILLCNKTQSWGLGVRLSSGISVAAAEPASHTKSLKSYHDLPGPKPLPYIGNMLDLQAFGKYPRFLLAQSRLS